MTKAHDEKIPTIFLQAVIVLFGAVVLTMLLVMPSREGRAANLDLISIYTDPFILYGYGTSVAFFMALYHAFRLLGYIGQNQVFTSRAVKALKNIKRASVVFCILIVLAGLYISLFHDPQDDAAGFLGLCIITTLASVVVVTASAIFERLLQSAIDIKSENDLTI